ncbi:MAG: hypothetical protein AVDCRST_MAG90-1763, partial [uncultured Microvirga sp.]
WPRDSKKAIAKPRSRSRRNQRRRRPASRPSRLRLEARS